MSGLVQRFTTTLKNGLAQLLAPAEDPQTLLPETALGPEHWQARVAQARASYTAARERLGIRQQALLAQAATLETQARRAVALGHDDVARAALHQRQLLLAEQEALVTQQRELERDEHQLVLIEQRLETWQAQQALSAARVSAAEARVQAHEALSGLTTELTTNLEQAEQRAEHLQARAAVLEEMLRRPEASVDEVTQLEAAAQVEAQLAALKRLG